MRICIAIAATALLLAGCAQRPPRAIETVQAHDGRMNCQQLRSEISASHRLIGSYGVDHAQQSERNRQAVIGAVINPMSLMNMDTGNAADHEVAAYSARIAHLETLSQQKACTHD